LPPLLEMRGRGQTLKTHLEDRFEFGKNWQRFLRLLDEERIRAAEASLREMLGRDDLNGQTFLDVGSGSGLFSLAAHRLGAKVLSFDYDDKSVACAMHLRQTFFPGDEDWRIEQGSVLDREYLERLGRFDIVYSWGVLHHTGAMWKALDNVSSLVKPGGVLFLAIYNDQGARSKIWRVVKKIYNRTPSPLRFVIVWPIGAGVVAGMTIKDILRGKPPRVFSRSAGARGMSVWTDLVDWVGGYPFEVASPKEIVDFYQDFGFNVERLVTCGRKSGCNQFVLRKTGVPSSSSRQ
jgi:2-polyprenyl-3-methyl-5-hydroxy-6-metoxy-1,4-benzoquinol methylase